MLSDLQEVKATRNAFSEEIPSTLGKLTQLTILDLSEVSLVGSLLSLELEKIGSRGAPQLSCAD
jgi:hypothetical protein